MKYNESLNVGGTLSHSKEQFGLCGQNSIIFSLKRRVTFKLVFFDLVVPDVHIYVDEYQCVRGDVNTHTFLVWSGLISEDHCLSLGLEPRLSQLTNVFLKERFKIYFSLLTFCKLSFSL